MPEVLGILCILLALVCVVLCVLQFRQKGVPLNNAYLWASEVARRRLDCAALFRQSAVIFGLIALMMLLIGLECILNTGLLLIGVGPLVAAALIYAVVSSIRIARQGK